MDYEKKYKDALERMKSWAKGEHPECFSDAQKAAEFIFPELKDKESEDERMFREIKRYIKEQGDKPTGLPNGTVAISDMIAWLEKQGERKSAKWSERYIADVFEKVGLAKIVREQCDDSLTNAVQTAMIELGKGNNTQMTDDGYTFDFNMKELKKIEQKPADDRAAPKFHEGEWIVCNGLTLYVKEVALYVKEGVNGYYRTIDQDDMPCNYDWDIDYLARLWTIQDAKDGDVLANVDNEYPFIYKGCLDSNHPNSPVAYCGIDSGGDFTCSCVNEFNYWWTEGKVQPATKGQRELLFQKMKEDGWEWDAKKKELSKQPLKITPKFCIGQLITDDNSTWYNILNIVCFGDWYYKVYDVCKDTTHFELCSIIDERFRKMHFVSEIKKTLKKLNYEI